MSAQACFALINPFVQMCVLRLRPQDLPLSPFLMWLCLAVYTVTSVIGLATLGLPWFSAALAGPLATAMLAGLTMGLLALQDKLQRATQTLTALAGCGAVLNVIATPFTLNMRPDSDGAGVSVAAALGFSLLILWSFVITAHVLRHALSTSFFFGLVLAIVFNLISNQALELVFEFEPTES